MKARGRVLSPFNVITGLVMLVAVGLLVIRYARGLGSITNLDQRFPWGLWIGFDVVTGVAFAGGAYVVTFMVYILGQEKYHPIVRATVLNGFLSYVFYGGALLLDLGRPWKVVNPIIGNSFGVSSALFLVAWHFLLYTVALFVEFCPVVAEWFGWRRVRKALGGLTLGAVIVGITLSTGHQAGLGAMYLMAKDKIHPLWYSDLIPYLFLVSSVFAGLSLVIFEGSITHRVFHRRVGAGLRSSHDDILVGLARICAGVMFVYLFMEILALVQGRETALLATGWGSWYLLEVIGFVAVPATLFTVAYRSRNLPLIRGAAAMTMIGILLNRLNVSIIAFRWSTPNHYVPSWEEVVVSLAVVSAEIWVFRWVVNRMPVLATTGEERAGDGLLRLVA